MEYAINRIQKKTWFGTPKITYKMAICHNRLDQFIDFNTSLIDNQYHKNYFYKLCEVSILNLKMEYESEEEATKAIMLYDELIINYTTNNDVFVSKINKKINS